jgi:rare lipoprotein A
VTISRLTSNTCGCISLARALAAIGLTAALAACTTATTNTARIEPTLPQQAAPVVAAAAQPAPGPDEAYRLGKPYQVAGTWYEPKADPDYDRTGMASWYGVQFHGRRTANGEIFDSASLSAAHPTLPLPSYVRVTNLDNGRSIVVRVNDRGPYTRGRLIDVSERTAELLDFKRDGSTEVRVQYAGKAAIDADDRPFLLASYSGPGPAPALLALASAEAAAAPGIAPPRLPAPRPGTIATAAAAPAATSSAVAFAETAEQAPSSPLGAVDLVTTGVTADQRILMAFQTADSAGD